MGEHVGLSGWGSSVEREKDQGYGKFQFQEHARRSLVKPPAQSNIRRCDNMAQGPLKPSLEKPQGCKHSLSGYFAPLWTVSTGKNVALSLQCKLICFK